MIVDSSAVVAIMLKEPEREAMIAALDSEPGPRLSAASYLECGVVLDRWLGPVAGRKLDQLLDRLGVQIEPVTEEQARVARAAYRDFGRGSGHRANLNYGDCFSYALASVTAEPLLFKGDDFGHTDLRSALP